MFHLFVACNRLGFLLTFAIVVGVSPPVQAFSIHEVQAADVHQAGQPIAVGIELGELPGVTKVNYYWYPEDEDMLQESAEHALTFVATSKHIPPFGGNILIPEEAIGTYRLLAVAEQGGRQSQVVEAIFDEMVLNIEPNAELLDIDFQTKKPLRFGRAGGVRVYDQLDALGTTFEVPVVGFFSDGITRKLRHHTTGTTYHSADPSVVTVNQDGVLRLVGNGVTVLTVKNRKQVATLDILVEVNDEPNLPPESDAGEAQIVFPGKRVTLNGLGSYDPDGGSLRYHWAQVRGSKIPLLDPYSAKARFLAPLVAEERTFRFKLGVTDNRGAESQPSYIDIIVRP